MSKFFYKLLIRFFQFLFFFIVVTKIYADFFSTIHILKFELLYNFYPWTVFLLFVIITIYIRFILTLVWHNNNNFMFFSTLKTISLILFIYNYGFLLYLRNFYKKVISKLITIINNYWKFRLTINPLFKKFRFMYHSIYDKTIKEKEKKKENDEKKIHEDWLKNYKKNSKDMKHMDMIKKRKPNMYKNKTNKNKETIKDKETIKNKEANKNINKIINKKTITANLIINIQDWINLLLKNKKNKKKFIFYILNILFIPIDVLVIFISNFIHLLPNIIWKPFNIRLPYFKKINKTNLKKKKYLKLLKKKKSLHKFNYPKKIKFNPNLINFRRFIKNK